MSAAVVTHARRAKPADQAVFVTAVTTWFLVTVIGQWAFAYYIAVFYGATTLSGDVAKWNDRPPFPAFVAGDTAGNLVFGAHVLLAAILAFGGALQLVPQIRSRAITFHRYMGRLFVATALATSAAGLYLTWVRHDYFNLAGAIPNTLNAALIIVCAAAAWRFARSRNVAAHRRWALRAYLVANAQWFLRIGVYGWIVLNHGRAVGMTNHFDGPMNRVFALGCYVIPLALLELYLWTKDRAGPRARYAMAGLFLALAGLTAFGVWAIYTRRWHPTLQQVVGSR
jgi:uncharacterized membrane protein